MSWMRYFFKKKGNSISMVQDATNLSGTLAVAGAFTATGGITTTGGASVEGINIYTHTATPEGAITAARKGDWCVDYTNANLYVFAGTAGTNTGWKLVTRAE